MRTALHCVDLGNVFPAVLDLSYRQPMWCREQGLGCKLCAGGGCRLSSTARCRSSAAFGCCLAHSQSCPAVVRQQCVHRPPLQSVAVFGPAPAPGSPDLHALWRKGKGTLLCHQTVIYSTLNQLITPTVQYSSAETLGDREHPDNTGVHRVCMAFTACCSARNPYVILSSALKQNCVCEAG